MSPACQNLKSRIDTGRVFTQDEIDRARRRMPTEKKMMTGLFKWKDIKRWHTTWQAWLSTCIASLRMVTLY